MGEVMSAQRLAGLTTLLLLALALPAAATQCETFTNHSGFVPDGWTATFTENNINYGPYEGPTFVDPELAHEGNRTWDRAVKCRTVEESTTTTTTPTSTTTTTQPSTTTTTEATTTTTTQVSTTTTAPPATTTSEPSAPSSTVPTPSTTGPSNPDQVVLDTLPYTGASDVWTGVASLLTLVGLAVLTVARRKD